jgi:hypothetical protein
MAVHGEVVLRLRVCLGKECRAVFFLCSHCDRGQRYCSQTCRQQARLHQRRCANRRHQQSPEGRLDHRDRQREYRQRRSEGAGRACVTDHSSVSIVCPASSAYGEAPGPVRRLLPLWPERQWGADITRWLRCRICGRAGRFIDPYSRLPRRR